MARRPTNFYGRKSRGCCRRISLDPRRTLMNADKRLLLLGLVLLLSGCTNAALVRVQPWQRGPMTDYTMRPDRDPTATMMAEHTYFSREAANGGKGVGGSGCGCN